MGTISPSYLSNFNPRSSEGSDEDVSVTRDTEPDFNPRSREGSDDDPRLLPLLSPISIHAPVTGATGRLH